jgi:hypothetical protein
MPDRVILKAKNGQGIYHGHDEIPESAIIKGLSCGDTTIHTELVDLALMFGETYDKAVKRHEKAIGRKIIRDVTGSDEA